MTTPASDDAAARAARRAYIRAHHPDAGGDPRTFAAGLAALAPTRPTAADASAPPRPTLVSVYRSRRIGRVLVRSWRQLRRRLDGLPPRTLS
ncbi:hypothetical protein [Jatrophihabitans endophyticus]|uniref:hypothetical protein n=1 Tax=Jatrophihabitans endophyticus TaxID=1206085 RepID=UPI0019F8AB89|nr:hypothetical protein [Jatrophihabitans endophyticus]MBE7189148.1 hypothetical protein [Jatrophihabitans endophyticus]